MRHGNRIAPTMMSDYSGGDQAVYARVNKLPPLDNSRRYLVASEVRHLLTLFFICLLYQSVIHALIGFYPIQFLYQCGLFRIGKLSAKNLLLQELSFFLCEVNS